MAPSTGDMARATEKTVLLSDVEGKEGGADPVALEKERERQIVENANHKDGLSEEEWQRRLEEYGPNALPEQQVNMCLKFLSYYWGAMPGMIWAAIIVEAISQDWADFGVLVFLQVVNGTLGFIEERNAGNAVAALKNSLKPLCRVMRGGVWATKPASELVPGDLVELKLGDVIPADCVLLQGEPLQVDQSALTGESLPVTVHPGGKVVMGSTIKRGEIHGIVVATGKNTFFGKAADLLNIEESAGRFQQVLQRITLGLLALSIIGCAIIYVDLLVGGLNWLTALGIVIVLLVASIPIATQIVCTTTLAIGSRRLAQRKVIVVRLSSIEELAGMTILCSDKTGTLTQNKLSLREPILLGDMSEEELVFYAALASKRLEGSQDAIDLCICQAVKNKNKLKSFKEVKFVPFNPTDKRTESTVEAPDGSIFKVSKGAPQVILNMSHNRFEMQSRVDSAVQSLSDRGFRSLGVAISYSGADQEDKWEFEGILALFDPPRYDTKETISTAVEMGVEVKMVTGDHSAIAKETCRELGMGVNILNTHVLNDPTLSAERLNEIILSAHGFAEVFPEHKFQIVESLRNQGFVVGMTGDGVNDAPALKRADIGIAVSGATDAAKAAADIVLIEEGLSVIIEAIQRSRKIFQRMRNYCIYRVACTFQLLFFFFFAVLFFKPQSYYTGYDGNPHSFTLPVLALVILVILNDGTIITIAYDKVIPDRRPQAWNLGELLAVSMLLGFTPCLSSIIMLMMGFFTHEGASSSWYGNLLGSNYDPATGAYYMVWGELQTMMYMKISLSDFLTVFSARTRGLFWERRPGSALVIAFVVATAASTVLSAYWFIHDPDSAGGGMKPLAWKSIWAIWLYNLVWFVIQDIFKVVLYFIMERLRKDEDDAARKREGLKKASAALEADDRAARQRSRSVIRETSSLSGSGHRAAGGAAGGADSSLASRMSAMEAQLRRIDRLEAQLTQVLATLQSMQSKSE